MFVMNIIIPHGFELNYTIGFVKGLLANKIDLLVISSDTTHEKLVKSNINCVNLRGSHEDERNFVDRFANLVNYYINK